MIDADRLHQEALEELDREDTQRRLRPYKHLYVAYLWSRQGRTGWIDLWVYSRPKPKRPKGVHMFDIKKAEAEAREEVAKEAQEAAKAQIKAKLKSIEQARRVVANLEREYEVLLREVGAQ